MEITPDPIDEALRSTGLRRLGSFQPEPSDGVPDCQETSTLILVGNAGPDMWRGFSSSDIDENDPNPLDNWSRRVLGDVAEVLTRRLSVYVQALFPFDGPPYMPFQRWALRSGAVHPSPIGPLIHGDYGLWHAYRGALLIAAELKDAPPDQTVSPCLVCTEKPCLTTCPVNAFSEHGYDVPACLDLLEKHPNGDCLSASCLARRACPVGRAYIYEQDHARFHMEKFLKSQRP